MAANEIVLQHNVKKALAINHASAKFYLRNEYKKSRLLVLDLVQASCTGLTN